MTALTLERIEELLTQLTIEFDRDIERDTEHVARLRDQIIALRELLALRDVAEAARALVAKMDVIHADDQYRALWIHACNRGMPYTGPNYVGEIGALRAALYAAQPDAKEAT